MKCLALKHIEFLKSLPSSCKNKKKLKKKILTANGKEISAISEICYNLLKGNIPCNPNKIEKLAKYVNDIRFIANRKNSLKKRKNIIVRKGSGLMLSLIPFAISAISNLLRK